ncbi:MAG: site-specific integrase [Vallitaleaceae bacterium]|nr:site-specific integrase [Vallitaleaceae bacterium]
MSNDVERLLLEALNDGKINVNVLETIDSMKKQKVNNIHDYTITPPKTSLGRWQTYIKGDDDNRKKITATTETKLYRKLYNYYFINVIPSLKDVLPEWLDKKRSENVSPRSIRRYENFWNKYYADEKIIQIPVNKITSTMIEEFFHKIIREHCMTVKELNNMKYPFKDIMKMVRRNGLTQHNPYEESEIKTYACKPPKRQSDTSRVYLPKEKLKMFHELNREINDYPAVTDCYAIFLLFKLGLRIGEVVALREADIDYENNEIHIHQTETLELNHDGILKPIVVEHTKKKSIYGDRYLPLGDYELRLIETVRGINAEYGFKDENFLFIDENGRTKARAIDNRIRKLCNKAGIPVKSAHDIRRTVASEMHTNGVPVEIIRQFLGHADIKTTWSYIFNNQNKAKTSQIIQRSLSQMNGLKGTH